MLKRELREGDPLVIMSLMRVKGIIWLRAFVDKLALKHSVSTQEVKEVFDSSPRFRFVEKGIVEGEDLYAAMGQTSAGRYLIVFYVHKLDGRALVISAREMDQRERTAYAKK